MWLGAIRSLLYPELCMACQGILLKHEHFFCLSCYADLPFSTYFSANPIIRQSLYGRADVHDAYTLFDMRKQSRVQQVLHGIKYQGQKEAAVYLGEMAAERWWPQSPPPDYIIPVPLHYKKQKRRGYNQSEEFAKGVAANAQIPLLIKSVKRTRHTSTQTRKSRFERWKNVAHIFEWKGKENLDGKHILLLDDVLTTGSTLEALFHCVRNNFDCKVSVGCIAVAVR